MRIYCQRNGKRLTNKQKSSILASMSNWTFSIRWLDEKYVLLSWVKDDKTHEITMPITEYVEFMELAHTFNTEFGERINEQIVKHYLND